jgi:radical SAM superfamily enzyme YgiQ (UPF0313 family)
MGRRAGKGYIRTWQMEPLQPALLAGLTPPDIALRFHDDRLEPIPFDEPTDLVAISVETYAARRAYQIASEFRRRGVPVVMGGFHATLCPEEVADYAEAVVEGEAEAVWPELLDDARHGRLRRRYCGRERPSLAGLRYDRSIYARKRYLPIGMVESGRGCRFRCEFCAVQSFFDASYRARPVDDMLAELRSLSGRHRLFFFVDDNFVADMERAKQLARAMAPLGIRWVTQLSINAAHDQELLDLLAASGCRGVLIGFESLSPDTLGAMRKGFNQMDGGYEVALDNLRRRRIPVYATFVLGYDGDGPESFGETLEFALRQRFYLAAFAHLLPFPGTPLYARLEGEGRLLHPHWWMDPDYGYNRVTFAPQRMSPEALQQQCLQARRRFFSLGSILRRGLDPANRADAFMWRTFFPINLLHRYEIGERNHYPLGDAAWRGTLLKVQ